ncbi:Reverse transcriptase [Phytophthora palmivora]|uniref:Reverse transcriptase n=1 Tax=Phytophthora palmivora TaxID=4796 RepID=A0A2P4XFN7_9STRA|nr:Reverse transcriptase [Phytophthora palmivora]
MEGGSEHNEILMGSTEPMVGRPSYPAPRAILKRPVISQIQVKPVLTTEDQSSAGIDPQDRTPIQKVKTEVTSQNLDPLTGGSAEGGLPGQLSASIQEASSEDRNNSPDPEPDPEVHYHEGNDLYAEDVDQEMAILPEINPTTDEVKIEDTQVGDPGIQTTAEIERLHQRIWKYRHLLIGKGNALPPAARGVVCDIDVGYARPIAQRVRKIAPRFREKLSDLIKGLLSAKMISYSRSPWASPIVVIVKKNGVDIRLCIDYRLVNSLTQLMVYPMPLINDLLEDLDKVLWYCSLDMASGFWVVTMTARARAISAFITPFGLFEWNRMPFGLKNAPQIYQRLIDNALYGFTRIPPPDQIQDPQMWLKWGKPMIRANHHGRSTGGVSTSVVKSFWGMSKVEYLGHRVSKDGLEANPKDLKALTDLAFPGPLRSMQSFLGSLNYYSRFIEDYAIYASVLYELRGLTLLRYPKIIRAGWRQG